MARRKSLTARAFIAALASRALSAPIFLNEKKAEIIDDIEAELRAAGRPRSNRKILAISFLSICAGSMTLPISDSQASTKDFSNR